MDSKHRGKAAFFDLEGTLLSSSRAAKIVPSRTVFGGFFPTSYRGLHRDRLVELADELFERTLKPSIHPGAEDLILQTRQRGYRTVLLTSALDLAVRPIALHFEFDDVIANRLEFRNHVATGKVLAPRVAETQKATRMLAYAELEDIDLDTSCAFSDSASDIPMLSATGHPVATNPTRSLRRFAGKRSWPILDLSLWGNGDDFETLLRTEAHEPT